VTVCPLFCKVNEVSSRNNLSALGVESTTVPTMSIGDCRAKGAVPQAETVSTQKPSPLSPESHHCLSKYVCLRPDH
jgi:hypothetical protein